MSNGLHIIFTCCYALFDVVLIKHNILYVFVYIVVYCVAIHDLHLFSIAEKFLTETGSRTTGLSFNVRVLYQLSYPDCLLFCYLNLEVVLITRALYGVFSATRGRQGSYMYVGIYNSPGCLSLNWGELNRHNDIYLYMYYCKCYLHVYLCN